MELTKKILRISNLYIVLLIILTSCGIFNKTPDEKAQRHVRKAFNHLEKAKKFVPTISLTKVDTVKVPIIIEGIRVDTLFKSTKEYDTVTITKDRLRITYVKLPGDSIFIEGKVKHDTVYVNVPVVTDTIIKQENYKGIVMRLFGLTDFGFWFIHIFIATVIGLWAYFNITSRPLKILDKIRKFFF